MSRPDHHQFQSYLGIKTRQSSTIKLSLNKTLGSVPYHTIINHKVTIEQIFTFGFVMFPREKSKTSGLVPPAFTCTHSFPIPSITCLNSINNLYTIHSQFISNSFPIPATINFQFHHQFIPNFIIICFPSAINFQFQQPSIHSRHPFEV